MKTHYTSKSPINNEKVYVFVLSFLILCSILYSCKKSPRGTEYIDEEVKAFTNFREGTWWAYEHATQHWVDTWKLVAYENAITPYNDTRQQFNEEKITLYIESQQYDTFSMRLESRIVHFWTPKYLGDFQAVFFHYDDDSIYACDNNRFLAICRDTLNGNCIRREFKFESASCSSIFPTYTQWSRDTGLIRMVYPNGDSLKLVACKIVR